MNKFQINIYRTEISDLLPVTLYCYDGFWDLDDPAHPGGGRVQYTDEYGNTNIIDGIWAGYPVNFYSSTIPITTGVSPCA